MMNLCLCCRRRIRTCVCPLLRPFETQARFVILMHPMEYKKEKVGTGRFSHLILKNSRLLVDVSFDQNPEFLKLLHDPEYTSYVLYPGDETIDLSAPELSPRLQGKPQFFVIDGTWPCAKKMMKLTTSLHHLPRVSFSATRASEFLVKHQPLPGCLSTVESIHQVLLELNRLGLESSGQAHDNLMQVFRHTVTQQLELAQDPAQAGYRKRAYKPHAARRTSKKWEQRLLFFRSGE
jgi:DTW domain-containing protein